MYWKEYLRNRNIDNKDIQEFEINYCKEDMGIEIKDYSYSFHAQYKYRNSIIIPIYDVHYNYLGVFSRRINPTDKQAKIDGSSFEKKKHLFMLNKSWPYILDRGFVFIVEGPFDAIAMWKHGYKNTVALMGTAFSDIRVSLLRRFTKKIYFVLDNDKAGKEGVASALKVLKNFDIESRNIILQRDPDDELKDNPGLLRGYTWKNENGIFCGPVH